MAAELVGGAALGAAFGLLIDTVKEAKKKLRMFRPALKDLSFTLESLKPLIEQMVEFNRVLNQAAMVSETFELELEEGEKLIRKCLKVHPLNLGKTLTYSNRLISLKKSLERSLKILQVEQARDVKETLGLVGEMNTRLQRIEGSISLIASNGVEDDSLVGLALDGSRSCSFIAYDDIEDSSISREPTMRTVQNSELISNERLRPSIKNWTKGGLLGRGSYGKVYEGIAEDGFFFAIKEVSLHDQPCRGKQRTHHLEKEIALLSQLKHENIVKYLGTDKDESILYIFFELVSRGSLQALYQRYVLLDSHIITYTRQILHGLKYLHERNVVHRDIKCANILVDASGSIKLCDFGLATVCKFNNLKSCKGTLYWMAPEVLKSQGCGLQSDIWSLGCTVLEMFIRQAPYHDLVWDHAVLKIAKGVSPAVPESLSEEARDFILQCLQVNPNDRPTAAQLLNHRFVRQSFPTSSGPGSASPEA